MNERVALIINSQSLLIKKNMSHASFMCLMKYDLSVAKTIGKEE